MKKTIGVLAHVDAGKTTFSEAILYHTKAIRKRGRVDHKDAFLDNHSIEKERGITVFAEQASFAWNDSHYYLIDTPGHVDFSPEMERAIQVMDYAIVILSAVEGVEGHTETVWELLQKHKVPTFFFINKTDREGANVQEVIEEIRENLTDDVCYINRSLAQEQMDDDLIESVAELDEDLLEIYMEKGFNQNIWVEYLIHMIQQNKVYPCFSGSALKDIGITNFIDNLDTLTKTSFNVQGNFGGQVYKIRYDEKGNRITFIKVLSGKVKVRDEVSYGDEGDNNCEKITQLRVYNGSSYSSVNEVEAGELCAVIGLTHAEVGDGVGELKKKGTFEMIPTLKSKVVFDTSIPPKDVWHYFNILDSEDPSLQVVWNEHFQEIHIHVMGAIQLEVLENLVKERFQLEVRFQEPEILYKETIKNQVSGYGHFEPLKHYAEVHLLLEASNRGSGITFENQCHANDLSIGNQNLVRHHIFEREHHGILTGSAITDMKITLLTGRSHEKHTSGGDFREATFRAIRQGLEKAENILLEPYYQFIIKVNHDHLGRVMSDVQQAFGTFSPPETSGDKAILTGKVPVSTFMNYHQEFASITHGKGILHLRSSGYDVCHNTEEVIERIDYKKDADPLYSSNSIFCAKGQGYAVSWDEVEEMLHC
ncbi:elongation factor G [Ornithinibacillus halophilus]|uniref:Small GTP-binding protein domain-containing protein n=1 Tax=Ornithinibacillus halophilus TaxID=930117 RepID=A0A1M5FL24_9BACI|nr:TetM/TetW/TetO/TetS family tetracycline resistance ribosomal protection protein [Ornithinibacillus halophilus]SHF92208.1 small GTP-binding protein domain-containing protein [Ornithinibacillus halophilus]